MDTGGQTVSATEFADLTGVSRERLRTWERRFGFPRPRRVANGPRRYALADAPHVVAVRRAADQGVPLAQAIADAGLLAAAEAEIAVSAATLSLVAGGAPTPVMLVGGPEPLRVAYANATLRSQASELSPGARLDAVAWFPGSDVERTLRTLFAGDTSSLECRHPAWGDGEIGERSLAYRLPPSPGEPPLVALVGVERVGQHDMRRELGELKREHARLRARGQRLDRWIGLTATLAERFQREADAAMPGIVAATMVRGLGAVDAGIAIYAGGELVLGPSTRAVLDERRVTVTGFDDLAALMHAGHSDWLTEATGRAFGVGHGLHGLGVPIVVVGETLGLLLLVFDERGALDEDAQRLLTVVSAGLGFLLLRDRLVASGQAPAVR